MVLARPAALDAVEATATPRPAYDVSIVMPCLNEEQTIGACIRKAREGLQRLGLRGEIIVCDNGSTDRSVEIAESLGARVVHERRKGYGSAYMRGIAEAQAEHIIIGDSDDTYDFTHLEPFIQPLRDGYDLVMGSRFAGTIMPGAMTFSHRYIGNPVLSGILRAFYRVNISDAHCGMRSFTRAAYRKMGLQTTGMEFASEMVVNAGRARLKIAEVPITYHPRLGESKLETWRDGWRHLRFMLLYSPTHLFLLPGLALLLPGLALLLAELPGPFYLGGRGFYIHFMILGSMLTILGYQILNLALYAKSYALSIGVLRHDRTLDAIGPYYTLERGLKAGGALFLGGLLVNGWILVHWLSSSFGALDAIRPALFASTLIVVGAQTMFSSFFLSLLAIRPGERQGEHLGEEFFHSTPT
jgi:glycosyltransferase involved in cell wall biosynthesis